MLLRNPAAAASWLLLAMSRFARADCECGYALDKTDYNDYSVYTELLENDFLHTKGDNITKFGWRPQEFNVSAEDGHGKFGKDFAVENVVANPLKDADAWTGESEEGGDAGLQLWVRGDHSNGFVSAAELATNRDDFQYGTFRVGMKMSNVNGTCGSFFYFHNDSQEIDMEFLSWQFSEKAGAVNLVLQTPMSVAHGYDASNTSAYKVQPLPFSPDEHFHEYRFDWFTNKVVFYVDGEKKYEMTEHIPTEPGPLLLNHWSNGNEKWSAGPPEEDTAMTVSYVKAYFNSSDPERHEDYQKRCSKFDPAKVCTIPTQQGAPEGDKAQTYFFSQDDTGKKTPGQETFKTTNSASSLLGSSSSLLAFVPVAAAILSCLASL